MIGCFIPSEPTASRTVSGRVEQVVLMAKVRQQKLNIDLTGERLPEHFIYIKGNLDFTTDPSNLAVNMIEGQWLDNYLELTVNGVPIGRLIRSGSWSKLESYQNIYNSLFLKAKEDGKQIQVDLTKTDLGERLHLSP